MGRSLMVLMVIALTVSLMGCIEPSREGYRDIAADTVCDEMDRCGRLGSGGEYSSYSDCVVEERSRFNSMWPESHCGDGKINADRFDDCMRRAELWACSGTLLDFLAAADSCHRNRVCID